MAQNITAYQISAYSMSTYCRCPLLDLLLVGLFSGRISSAEGKSGLPTRRAIFQLRLSEVYCANEKICRRLLGTIVLESRMYCNLFEYSCCECICRSLHLIVNN